jgi:GNAT superfamily N-acetyltransferase
MFSIEPVRPEDLPATAELHRRHLRLGLFPRLGRRFLAVYHETFLASPHGVALVARANGQVVGALFGTTSNPDHYRWAIRNHGWRLAWHGARSLLFQPRLAWRFVTTRFGRYAKGLRRHLAPRNRSGAPRRKPPVCVLSHIVTSESARQCGVGRRLVEHFKARARAQGAQRASLVTRENGPGVPFFERIGGECVAVRREQDGSPVREYHLSLEEKTADEKIEPVRRRGVHVRSYRPGFRAGAGADARRGA